MNTFQDRTYWITLTVFALAGIIMPYSSLWIESQGIALANISVVVSIGYLWRSLLTLTLAVLFRSFSPAQALGWLSCALVAVSAFMFHPKDATQSAFLAVFVIGLTFALQPMAEAFLVQRVNKGTANYPITKLSGSLIFACSSIAVPFLYVKMPIEQIYPLAIGVIGTAIFAATLTTTIEQKTNTKKTIGDFFKIVFLLFPVILPAALIQGSNGFYYAMAFVVWKKAGIDPSVSSLLWAVAIAAEIITFRYCINFFEKASTQTIFTICAAFSGLRWLIFAGTSSVPFLFFAQIGHAFSFALVHAVLTREIALQVKDHEQFLAHGVGGFFTSFGLFLCMSILVPAALSIEINPYIAMAALCAVSFVTSLFFAQKNGNPSI